MKEVCFMCKIVFCDVDGPLIPGRMYYAKNGHYSQEHGAFIYDPVAVGMLRELCKRCDAKIVYSTAHNETDPNWMRRKARINGMEDLLHEDCRTEFRVSLYNKKDAIVEWLRRHPEIGEKDWIVIDDEHIVDGPSQIKVDFGIGLTIGNFFDAVEYLSGKKNNGLIVY
jgi:hypothetical protein